MAEASKVVDMGLVSGMRALRTILQSRNWLSKMAGMTFGGKRNLYEAMGYKDMLDLNDFWSRYERGDIAARIIEAFPEGTWRGEGEVYEIEDPKKWTDFEKAWKKLAERLSLWPMFLRGDTLAGIGQYAGILIGAPGSLKEALPKSLKDEDIAFLMPYSQRDCQAKEYVTDKKDPRFGEVQYYEFKRVETATLSNSPGLPILVHWSRVIHVPSDKLLDDNVNGIPRLQRVWNRLDDLDKVLGAGSEAFWLRAHQGYQFNLDKDVELDPTGEAELDKQINEFMDGFRRAVKTRGMEMNTTKSDVATFDRNVLAIIGLISAATKIPQRILMGSEQGQLASQQDRVNWAQRVQDRRKQFAEPHVVRVFVNRMQSIGVLPPTPDGYKVWWPEVFDLSDDERAVIAARWAEINQKNKRVVVTTDEIRDRILGLGPLSDEDVERENKRMTLGMPAPPSTRSDPPAIKGNEPTR